MNEYGNYLDFDARPQPTFSRVPKKLQPHHDDVGVVQNDTEGLQRLDKELTLKKKTGNVFTDGQCKKYMWI
ncbi:hypothetical protein KIN20_018887 [Parelaphostrongylus tenuis]|uniref:Uncharacterized protein n=1 Tax=Parelaphostrongylus tenuis TaxID=148309 RepID=A0AAD5QUQ3_PARTN|nr:hypothetical protein KIN20_018887 [Parelaphostrongylus tenuis]